MFASVELAARIERAECGLLLDCTAPTRRARPGDDAWTRRVGGGIAAYAGPGSPLNKVAGLGFAAPPEDAELADLERAFHERAVAVQVELSSLADPALAPRFSRRGYALQGFENVLGVDPASAAVSIDDGIEVTPSPDDEFDAWLDVLVEGFATPDDQGVAPHEEFSREELRRAIGGMAGGDGFERYLARREGAPVGGACLRIADGVAQFCGAATLSGQRRRGVQTRLLAARLSRARSLGCDVAVVTTQPGSRSQQNVQRRGFRLLYTRAILVLPPPG